MSIRKRGDRNCEHGERALNDRGLDDRGLNDREAACGGGGGAGPPSPPLGFSNLALFSIDPARCGGSDSANFPVWIDTTDNHFKTVANGGLMQNASAFDARPYALDLVTPLIFELEPGYSGSVGRLRMHVNLPSVSHSVTTQFYMAFGNIGLNSDGSLATTWNTNFTHVYHLGNGTTLNLKNSAQGSLGNANNTNGVTAAAGQVNGCGSFVAASSQFLDSGNDAWPNGQIAGSVSMWIKATSFPAAYTCPGGTNAGTGNTYFIILAKSTGKLFGGVTATGGAVIYDGTGLNTLVAGTWYHLALTYDSTTGLNGYVNGVLDKNVAPNGNLSITSPGGSQDQYLGNDPINAGRFWNGLIDEFRASKVVRSADWWVKQFNNQNSPSTFYSVTFY